VPPPRAEDARVYICERIRFVLRPLIDAVGADIPGARVAIEVGGLECRPGR